MPKQLPQGSLRQTSCVKHLVYGFVLCFGFFKLWEIMPVQVGNPTCLRGVGRSRRTAGIARLCCWNSWSQAQAAALRGALHGSCASSAASAAPQADLTAVHLGTGGRVAEFGGARRTEVGWEQKKLEPCKNTSRHLTNQAS